MSNNLSPLVTVITPLFNSEDHIEECINSVLQQSYTSWEMIVVDDCSTDNSAAIVKKKCKEDDRIQYYRLEQNKGNPYAARNLATELAKGKYIAFLDSDDMWLPDKLKKQVSFMEEQNAPVSFTAYKKKYENNPKKHKVIYVPASVGYNDLLKTNHIGNLTAMYNTEITGKLYQVHFPYEDYIMWVNVLRKGYCAFSINEVLAIYRVHTQSLSSNKFQSMKWQWEIYRNVFRLPLLSSCWYLFHYIKNGIKKI